MTITPTLIVDDSLMITKIIKKALLTTIIDGYHFEEQYIYTAFDGMEAFEMIGNNNTIKLIISDINMPNLNGDEFIEILQDTGRLDNLDVVFVTSSSDKLLLKSSLKENILGIINKPFKFDEFNKQLKLLQTKKIEIGIEKKRIKVLQVAQKEHIKKSCIKYLNEFEISIKEDLLKKFIDENFGDDNVSKDEFPEIVYSILSSFLFELNSSHKLNEKKILCILKSFDTKTLLQENRFALISNFKNQIIAVNSNELPLKEVLYELTIPLLDQLSIAFVRAKNFPKLKPDLFSPYFEYIVKEFMMIDCDFIDEELQKLLLELKELIIFNKWIYNFLDKKELYTSVDIIKKSKLLNSEVTKRLHKAHKRSILLTQHYCGQIEFYLWKRAKESTEIMQYLKANMPQTIPCSSRFLLHKGKISKEKHSVYLPYEQQKVIVISNELQTLELFKGITKAPFDKWSFLCYSNQSLLDAWMHSNMPDKFIIDYNFHNSVFNDGIQFLKYLIKKYPALQKLSKLDQTYIIANNNQLLELNNYKGSCNFIIIQEPLVLKNIYDNLLYQ